MPMRSGSLLGYRAQSWGVIMRWTRVAVLAVGFLAAAMGAQAVEVVVPADQRIFIETMLKYREAYKQAPNQLKKSALLTQRREELQKLLPKAEARDWYAKLTKLKTTSDGHAWIEMKLDGYPFTVKTWNNALSDSQDRTLIRQSSKLFGVLSDLSEGTVVQFSGEFIKESSLSEAGGMTDPEWVVRFKDVRPVVAK